MERRGKAPGRALFVLGIIMVAVGLLAVARMAGAPETFFPANRSFQQSLSYLRVWGYISVGLVVAGAALSAAGAVLDGRRKRGQP